MGPINLSELRNQGLSEELKKFYQLVYKARAEIIRCDRKLQKLTDSEEDQKLKDELLGDKEQAEKDLQDFQLQVEILESLSNE